MGCLGLLCGSRKKVGYRASIERFSIFVYAPGVHWTPVLIGKGNLLGGWWSIGGSKKRPGSAMGT